MPHSVMSDSLLGRAILAPTPPCVCSLPVSYRQTIERSDRDTRRDCRSPSPRRSKMAPRFRRRGAVPPGRSRSCWPDAASLPIVAAGVTVGGAKMADRNHARVIDGAAIAAGIRRRVAAQTAELARRAGVVPGLTVVLVGNNPASEISVRPKLRRPVEAGLRSRDVRLPAEITQAALLDHIASLNADPAVDGVLVQMPLRPHIDADAITAAIDPQRDVDGFHPLNAGYLVAGWPTLTPCTPLGCIILLRAALGDLAGLNALVLGRSNIVGKPMALLLLRESCTVTIAHSRSRDLPALCRRADIVVAAIGRPEFVRGAWLKPGATIIDVGINRIEREGKRRIVGDVAFAEAVEVAGAITPVPGGVGPMTIACLLENTLHAACRRRGIALPGSSDSSSLRERVG